MSVSKVDILNSCENWIDYIEPLENLEFQRKYWFNYDGHMVSSYEEATGNVLQYYENQINSPNSQELCNQECQKYLKELYQKVDVYRFDDERMEKYDSEIALLEDPKWLEIVKLAQKTNQALKRNIEEVKNAEN